MESISSTLPDDIDVLKALLLERDAQVAELRQQLSSRVLEIEHLKLTIAKLRRMQFGRKSEKLDRQIEQLELRLEDLQADEGAADVAAAHETKRSRREGASRKPLPDHLEREERIHLPAAADCPDCGGRLKPLGEDVAEQLEYVRAHFRVIRHRRPKLSAALLYTQMYDVSCAFRSFSLSTWTVVSSPWINHWLRRICLSAS